MKTSQLFGCERWQQGYGCGVQRARGASSAFSTPRRGRKKAGGEGDRLGYGTDGTMAARPEMRAAPVVMRRPRVAFIAIHTIAATIRATPSQAITISRAGSALPMRGRFDTAAQGSHTGVTFPFTWR